MTAGDNPTADAVAWFRSAPHDTESFLSWLDARYAVDEWGAMKHAATIVRAAVNAAPTSAVVSWLDPDHTGADANHRDETNGASAIAVWLSDHGAVWVDEDGEIFARSRYSGACVADWHGTAILSAQRWSDTKMPVSRGETITAERAQNTPSGTVLARVGDNGRVIPGSSVIEKDNGFTASPTGRYRVLELARGSAS